MNKKVFDKKLQALKDYGEQHKWEYKVSEVGNHYIISNTSFYVKEHTVYNVTKGNLSKIGQTYLIPPNNIIVMLTKTGKFLQKDLKSNSFKALNRYTYPDLWYIGKKSEWLLYESDNHLKNSRIATGFSSFNSFKKFLGFDFLSDEKFRAFMFGNFELTVLLGNRTKEERVNAIKLCTKVRASDIIDCIDMARDLQQDIVIPAGENSLKELHDKLTLERNLLRTKNYSVNVILENFEIPYSYEVVTDTNTLKRNGQQRRHCIGSYTNKMKKDLFLVIDNKYDCHIIKTNYWQISQIRGFANCNVPSGMEKEINEALKLSNISITFNSFEEGEIPEEDKTPF